MTGITANHPRRRALTLALAGSLGGILSVGMDGLLVKGNRE